jgi:(p)ppGpp synthase/HD superfamily hydrolase
MTAPTRTEQQPWEDFGLVQRAAAYAAEAHRDDLRKGTTIPYLSHLWSVAALVLEHGGDDIQVAAALLHDVVEDHGGQGRLDEVRRAFGDEVASLVEALSDSVVDTEAGEQKPPWQDRKRAYLTHLEAADARVQLVSACDKLHNARAIVADHRAHGQATWARFNESDPARQLWYYQGLVAALSGRSIPTPLVDELRRTVEELAAQIRAYEPDLDARVAAAAAG